MMLKLTLHIVISLFVSTAFSSINKTNSSLLRINFTRNTFCPSEVIGNSSYDLKLLKWLKNFQWFRGIVTIGTNN